MISFIDRHSDLNTVNFMAKSLDSECLEKALDRTGLVQKDVQYKTPSGKIATRKQWVKAGEEQPVATPKQKKPKPDQRPIRPATPFAITPKTKHMVPVEDLKEIPAHVKDLIKPAWRCVMVSPDPNAELLVVGKDTMNRAQYEYSKAHNERVAREKFQRIQELMKIKDEVLESLEKLKEKDSDTADCLSLIYHTGLRPGSTNDTKSKVEALGATTLRGENVVEENGKVFLRFTGKKGVPQDHEILNKEVADMLVRRKKAAGDGVDLFNTNERKLRGVLRPWKIHTKDLRTMKGTSTAQEFLSQQPAAETAKEFVKLRNATGDFACKVLGNQRNMALNAYIDPSVFELHSPKGWAAWKSEESGG